MLYYVNKYKCFQGLFTLLIRNVDTVMNYSYIFYLDTINIGHNAAGAITLLFTFII